MKKLFPLALIAVFSVIAYTSCKKNTQYNDAHYCYCGYTDSNGDDSGSYYYEGYSAQFSSEKAQIQCKKGEAIERKTKPTVECSVD